MWRHARRNSIVIDGERCSSASMSQGRLRVLGVCFAVGYIVIALRLLDLSIVQTHFFGHIDAAQEETASVNDLAPRRGDVYDRNGFLVATTLKTPSLYVDPSMVYDRAKLAEDIMRVFPNSDAAKVAQAIGANNRFGWLAYDITPAQQQSILEIGDPSLGFKYNYTRVYPQGSLFSHMIGYTNRDGLGLSGVERGFDDVLGNGRDISLSLDLRIQHAVKREVSKAMNDFDAKAGVGVVIDVKTGEVLAGVSLPDFDLNNAGQAQDHEVFNRMTLGVYELGSVFKIFSTAAALELEGIDVDHKFDASKPLKVGWYKIRDYHAQKRELTLAEVFMYSSNIGSALIGKMLGAEALKGFYKDLGLLDPTRFEIKEIGRPIVPQKWREDTTMTVSYGHGLSTSPLQMSAAVATIVNGGIAVQPTLLKHRFEDQKSSDVRVISEKTSENMRKLLRLVVAKGTGGKANLQGFSVGGKTGTAEKSIDGKYHRDKLISSFVAAFPMHDPRYVIMVMVDEPKGNENSYGYATAGWVAAPAVKRIVKSMVSILGIPSTAQGVDRDISQDLLPYIKEPSKKQKKLASY